VVLKVPAEPVKFLFFSNYALFDGAGNRGAFAVFLGFPDEFHPDQITCVKDSGDNYGNYDLFQDLPHPHEKTFYKTHRLPPVKKEYCYNVQLSILEK